MCQCSKAFPKVLLQFIDKHTSSNVQMKTMCVSVSVRCVTNYCKHSALTLHVFILRSVVGRRCRLNGLRRGSASSSQCNSRPVCLSEAQDPFCDRVVVGRIQLLSVLGLRSLFSCRLSEGFLSGPSGCPQVLAMWSLPRFSPT